jgi:TetR/AcrR family transcriptional regulator, tetracycline repressor protein
VLEGALALLDADGLDALTMRKLAASLGVQAGALYWHFENKQALLDAMAERLVEGVGAALSDGAWDEQLGAFAARLRDSLLSHRDGARVVAGTYVSGPNTMLAGRTSVTLLLRAGFAPEQAGWLTFALAHYVIGHTIEEQARSELAALGEWDAKSALADSDEDQIYAEALASVLSADPAEQFAFALRVFLEGIHAQVPVAAKKSRQRPRTSSPLRVR